MNRIVRSPQMKRLAQWVLRAIGPSLLVILLWRVVDYSELGDILGGIRLPWAFAALAAVQLIILLRTLRWIAIHETFGLPPGPFGYQLRLTYATSIATLVLPQIVNPFSRLVLLVQDGYRAGRAAVGSVFEKLLDLSSYLSFGLLGSVALATVFGGLVWWALGLALATLAAGAALYVGRVRILEFGRAAIRRLPGIRGAGEGGHDDPAKDIFALTPLVLGMMYGWSLAIALTQATLLFFLARALGVELSYPYIVAVWGVVALSMLLPISVNGIGTREAILVVAFDAAGESTDAAVALGLLVLAAVAAGSSPGIIEWLRRAITGSGRSAGIHSPSGNPPDREPAPRVRTEGRVR